MGNLLRVGHRMVGRDQINRVSAGRVVRGAGNRIAPPKLTGWPSKFFGWVIGPDLVYPFFFTMDGINGKKPRRY